MVLFAVALLAVAPWAASARRAERRPARVASVERHVELEVRPARVSALAWVVPAESPRGWALAAPRRPDAVLRQAAWVASVGSPWAVPRVRRPLPVGHRVPDGFQVSAVPEEDSVASGSGPQAPALLRVLAPKSMSPEFVVSPEWVESSVTVALPALGVATSRLPRPAAVIPAVARRRAEEPVAARRRAASVCSRPPWRERPKPTDRTRRVPPKGQ